MVYIYDSITMDNLRLLFVLLMCSAHELLAYKNYSVENPDVCSRTSKKTIKLGSATQSALLITQRRLSDHRLNWQDDFRCSFEVKAKTLLSTFMDEGIGVFAVIQNMKLRQNPHTYECIDYIQFKTNNGIASQHYCGNLDALYAMDSKRNSRSDDDSDSTEFDDDDVSLTSYDDPSGQLTVYIFIDKAALQPGEETDMKIAFTAYKHCRNTGYRTCHDDRSKCIYLEFFNDGIINCPNYDCVDEDGCKPPTPADVDKPLSIGSHILIGSGTSLLITFAIFICCIYTCRKYGKFCWSEDFSRPPAVVQESPAEQHHTAVQVGNAESDTLTVPSAPPPAEDKDLPPSYESLFPPNVR